MDQQILAQNIRRLRVGRNFSQKALAEASGLSLPAIKNLESAKTEPRISSLEAIARALDTKFQELFTPVRQLKTVRFRSNKRMQNRENILAEIAIWLDNFNYLERELNERIPYKFVDDCEHAHTDIAACASFCRKILGLKDEEPIYDICGLLESAGVKVYPVGLASDGFFGLSVGNEDGGPAIIVNTWGRISVERQIFSAAHELGHLVLHKCAFDVSVSEENKEEEHEADLFAGHFLLPDKGFRLEWNEAAGLPVVDRVMKIKRIFRVSYKTILARLVEQKCVDSTIWMKFNVAFHNRFDRKLSFREEPMAIEPSEPYGMQRFDFYEDRYKLLTRKAIEGIKSL